MLLDIARYSVVLTPILLTPTLSLAADLGAPPSVRVHIGDLNLASPSGRHALTVRVSKAADQLCQKPAGHRELAQRVRFRACRQVALASAEPQIREAISAFTARVEISLNLDGLPNNDD